MVTFEYANKRYQTRREIGELVGKSPGPTVVLFGGIHGNEPSGLIAIQKVLEQIRSRQLPVRGRILGIAGNLQALQNAQRFIDRDLNRLWDREFTKRYQARLAHPEDEPSPAIAIAEHEEQHQIFSLIEPIVRPLEAAAQGGSRHSSGPEAASGEGPYFIDLHTTSSKSEPFIAINDQLENRRFALSFPVPTVLGIEEYLEGPLLSYLNDFGPVALAFEAGQHDDPESMQTHESFIWMALVNAGVLQSVDVVDLDDHRRRLECAVTSDNGIYEVIYRKPIHDGDHFEMKPGFRNFSKINKGDMLASDQTGPIKAHAHAQVFMPLYQNSGNDGFFLVRRVPGWALTLSRFLRNFRFERLLVWLPGVSRSPDQADALVVNKRVARFLATQIFHLLGYRRKSVDGDQLVFSRREIR